MRSTAHNHAISAHSFSAKIQAQTLEAKVVQDADRLDAMGAVGIFRCFAYSGISKRPLYAERDPFCESRNPNDSENTLDHFFTKLLHLQAKLKTQSAIEFGKVKTLAMEQFLVSLSKELQT